jgi:hypothetical protein
MKIKQLTKKQQIKLSITQKLFFDICDGYGHDDPELKEEIWAIIDKNLKSLKLTRENLYPGLSNNEKYD